MIGIESSDQHARRGSARRGATRRRAAPSRSTPTAASAATPSATQRWNRTGSRELPSDRDLIGPVEQERELAQHQDRHPGRSAPPRNSPSGRALRRPPCADDRQRHGDQAHVGVHLVIRVEAVQPVGIAGAGAVGLADDQGRQQLGVPRPKATARPSSAPRARGAVEQLLGRDPLHRRDQDAHDRPGRPPCPGHEPVPCRPRSVAAR